MGYGSKRNKIRSERTKLPKNEKYTKIIPFENDKPRKNIVLFDVLYSWNGNQ